MAAMSPGANAVSLRWSMFTQSGVVGGSSCRLIAAYVPRDERPRVRMSRRFAGEVPGIEFGQGGVEVVGVEHDSRHDPFVGVDFDDGENIDAEASGAGPGPSGASA